MPKGVHQGHRSGHQHYRWNNGQMIDKQGYVLRRVGTEHPLADPNGYVREHVLVWCAAGNPKPSRGQLIHHVNEDKTDNRLENLELKTKSTHNAEHNAKRFGRRPLTDADVAEIRRRRAAGEELKSIASDYGVAFQTISKIARGTQRSLPAES